MSFKSYRDESKAIYGHSGEKADREQLNIGSLQRIADATEKMAVSITDLMHERDRYKDWYERERRTAISLRGKITKLKKKINANLTNR
jgi:hypothetical protein